MNNEGAPKSREIVFLKEDIKLTPAFLISGVLVYVVALAWNAAANRSIEFLFPPETHSTAMAQLLYALIITAIVITIMYLYNCIISTEKVEAGRAQIEISQTV